MMRRAFGFLVFGVALTCASRSSFGQPPPAPAPAPAPAPTPAAAAAVPDGPAPHIKFDATEVNLGDVIHGDDAVATFTYHNTGSAPLHILSAKPG